MRLQSGFALRWFTESSRSASATTSEIGGLSLARKKVLSPSAKALSVRELLEKLILAVADHPGMTYYLEKHGLVNEVER